MRAAVVERLGEAPLVADVDEPTTGPNETVASVLAAGLNPLDLHLGSGRYGPQPTPHIVGREGVAEIDGHRRYFNIWGLPAGTMTERVAIDAATTYAIPNDLSTEQAIAVGSAGITALLTLQEAAGLREGESVLVLGVSGAVGQLAARIARSLGASRVVGAARNTQAASHLVLDQLVPLDDQSGAGLLEAADGGFDVVVDPIGGTALADAIPATAAGARIVTFGISAGRVAPIDTKALQGRSLIGFGAPSVTPEMRRDAYAAVVEKALAGELYLEAETFPLTDIARAWKLQGDSPNRKLIVTP